MKKKECKECKKTTSDNKFFPYCSQKHWTMMVIKG